MLINKRFKPLPLILLLGFALTLTDCQSVTIKNRVTCFINGGISLGSTCATTVGTSVITTLTTSQTLDMLEARDASSGEVPHAPAVFQSADDYGEETTELEVACRLLGNDCSFELQSLVANRKATLEKLKNYFR